MLVFNILRRFVWSLQSTDCAGRALACLFPFSAHMLPFMNGVPATPFGHEHALKGKILRQVALLRRVQPPGEKCGLKLSGGQRDRMRAGRPRSQAMPSRRCGRGCLTGDFSESRRAPFGKLPFAREPGPATPCGSFEEQRPIVNEDEPRMDTKEHEETRRQMNLLQRQVAPKCLCNFVPLG